MKRLFLASLIGLTVSCKSEIVTHQRLFTPGDQGVMTFKIPSNGLHLVIQPVMLPEKGPGAEAQTYPYSFEFLTVGADEKTLQSQNVQGFVHCDRSADHARTRRCPGSRVMVDLKATSVTPQYLRIKRDAGAAASPLYFAVTFRAPQSAYRARLHGLRLSPHEKAALLDTAYAGPQDDVKQLAALSTLAPLGEAEQDYRDRVVYQDAAAAPAPTPRFPSYAILGSQARIIVPLYQRDVPVRVRSVALGEAGEYRVCWQPMAEPVEGRCYKVARSASPDTTFQFPRGRLIFSAEEPMALDVEYPLTGEQKFHLSDAVLQYPVHRVPQGQTLSVSLEPFQANEFLPLRLQVWAVQSQKQPPSPHTLDLKVLGSDGHVRHQERLTLDSRPSSFDRSSNETERLTPLNSFYLSANAGGRLELQAGTDIFVNVMLGRASTPLHARLQAGGVIRADSEKEFWIPVEPNESTQKDTIASYAWNPDTALVAAQRVFFPTKDVRSGLLALTPTRVAEMTWEARRKTGHYVHLEPGTVMELTPERGPVLPMMLFGSPGSRASLRAQGHTLWEGALDNRVWVGHLDVARLPSAAPSPMQVQGAEFFIGGTRLAQNVSTVYGKRFYYAQHEGTFPIQKDLPQQTLNIEVLLTEAPAANARVQVTLQPQASASRPLVTREFTHVKRDYVIEPRPFAPDSFRLDGKKAELLTLPVPLRDDLPGGEYRVNVTTTGMKGMLLGVSSQLPNWGIRLTPVAERVVIGGDFE